MSANVIVHRLATAQQAVALLRSRPVARLIGGGTDLMPLARDGRLALGDLVAVRALGLAAIGLHAGRLSIGAGATMAEVADSPLVQREAPALVQALRASASPQVRNAATLGGNLLQRTRCPYFRGGAPACNRISAGSGCAVRSGDQRQAALFGGSAACVATHASDLAVALLALDARVHIVGPQGERCIELQALYPEAANPEREHTLEPDELITGIELPTSAAARRSGYVKVRDRAAFQFALVALAFAVDVVDGRVQGARLAAGGVGSRPWRLHAAEAALHGRGDTDWQAAAAAAGEGAEPLPGNAFKLALLQRLVAHAGTLLSRAGAAPANTGALA